MPTAIVRLVAEETFSWQKPVIDKDLATPPAATAGGNRYIVGAGAIGAWAGQDGKVAWDYASAWHFDTPIAGWIAWVTDEAKYYNYTTAWNEFISGGTGVTNIPIPSRLFDIDGNGDSQPVNTMEVDVNFDLDVNDDIMPVEYPFELDGNYDIMPLTP